MTLLIITAKAVGLIILAALIFLGVAQALDVSFAGGPERICEGLPFKGCYLTII